MKSKIKEWLKSAIRFFVPVKKVILFESNPDFSDNTYWLFKYIAETHAFSDYRFVWFLTDCRKKRRELCGVPIVCVDALGGTLKEKLRLIWYQYAAKIIVDGNRCIQKVRREQIRVYLGHGMPVKKVLPYVKSIGCCDVLITMGDGFRCRYDPYVDGGKEPFGYPRNEILTKLPVCTDPRYIVWMPTFRQHSSKKSNRIENSFPLGVPALKSPEELAQVQRCLEENGMTLFLRPHPAQDVSVFKVEEAGRILLADDAWLNERGLSLYEFLAASSALITDYSSVYYDYLLTERPIGLTVEDAEAFGERWGLWFADIRKEMPGYLIDNSRDMTRFIQSVARGEDECLGKRRAFSEAYGIEPRESSRLIVDYLQKKLENRQ